MGQRRVFAYVVIFAGIAGGVAMGLHALLGTRPSARSRQASLRLSDRLTHRKADPNDSGLPADPGDGEVPPPTAAEPVTDPDSIDIPRIHPHSTLIPLGLDAQGAIATPPLADVGQAGWYAGCPAPGENGPAVIVGHVDNKAGPGIFQNLAEPASGDEADIRRKDGSTAVFNIESVRTVPKDQFPTQQVYGRLGYPGLRLITCGGPFDSGSGHYVDNVIAFGRLVSVKRPG